MEALIRSAPLALERRQLKRPPVHTPGPPVAPVATLAEHQALPADVAQAEELEEMRRGFEEQLARRDETLAIERDNLRKEMEAAGALALEEARERGYAEGFEQGDAKGRAQLGEQAARLRSVLAELEQARRAVLDEAEDLMVEIAFTALCRLVGTESASRAAAAHAVREARMRVQGSEQLTIMVHPDDLQWLASEGQLPANALVASPAVALGGCMLSSAVGTLDARLESQLAGLRDALLGARAARHTGEDA